MGLFNHEAANRALDASDAPVQDAIRKIYLQGAASNAPAYQDPDLTIMRVSDMKSDASGYFDLCYVQDGEYRVEIESPQGDILYSADSVFVGSHLRTQELDEYSSTDQLRDDVFLSYHEVTGRYPVRPGQKILICSTDIQYKVMPAEESVPQLVSAGGVKFCQTGTRYTDLGCFKHAVARGESFSAGTMVFAGGTIFSFDDDGNTNLPGLTGWRRVVSPENDAHLTQSKAKTDLVSVTQPVNLDVVPALVAGSNTYDSVNAGLAGTADGDAFFVPTGPGLQLYRNDAGQGTFVGWQGEILFEDVDSFLTSTETFPAGVTIRTRREGIAYLVASNEITDSHLVVNGQNFYVQSSGGALDFKAWIGNVSEDEDVGSRLSDAIDAALQTRSALRLPNGTLTVKTNVFVTIPAHKKLHIFSNGGTKLQVMRNNGGGRTIRFRGETGISSTLASDAPRRAMFIEVDDASSVEVGDMLYILAPDTRVESGWGYRKNCIRKVTALTGNVVQLDQALDFFFTIDEGTTVASYKPAHVHLSRIDYYMDVSCSIAFRYLSGRVEYGDAEGPFEGWSNQFSDGFTTTSCDQFVYDHVNFKKFRYAPQIGYGSRNIQVRNFRAEQVRHLDANTWSQDILFENGIGISTDGIIQCHPCIRPVWRNVHDSVTGGLKGLDLRGMGETVEDCSVASDTATPGCNTNAPILEPEYRGMAAEMTRTLRRFRSNTAGIKGGREGRLVVEGCEVPVIGPSTGYSNPDQLVLVDDATVLLGQRDETQQSAFDRVACVRFGPVRVAPTGGRCNADKGRMISMVAQTAPAVVTSTNHGLRNGQLIMLSEIQGMTALNGQSARIAAATADTVELVDPDDGAPINTTGAGAYLSGGTLLPMLEPIAITAVTQAIPGVVTCPGHHLLDGDAVYLNGLSGMSDLNGGVFCAGNVTADSFELLTLSDSAPVDTTGFPEYVTGGMVTQQYEAIVVDALQKPCIGFGEKLWLTCRIYDESDGVFAHRPATFKIKVRDTAGGQVDQKPRSGRLRARLETVDGVIEYMYNFMLHYSGNVLVMSEASPVGFPVDRDGEMSLNLRNFAVNGKKQVLAAGANWTDAQSNDQYYWSFDVEIGSQGGIYGRVTGCDIEIEEWRM